MSGQNNPPSTARFRLQWRTHPVDEMSMDQVIMILSAGLASHSGDSHATRIPRSSSLLCVVWLLVASMIAFAGERSSLVNVDERGSRCERCEEIRASLFEACNYYRELKGRPLLKPSVVLRSAARMYAEDMQKYRYFGHSDRQGRGAMDRVEAVMSDYAQLVRENLHWRGSLDGDNMELAVKALKAFVDSPPHHESLIATDVSEMDFGVAIGPNGLYVVQLLAQPVAGPPLSHGSPHKTPE